MGLFTSALKELDGRPATAPRPFGEYAKAVGFESADTAASISVDGLNRLHADLYAAGVMVFRLGSPPGKRGTRFALAKHATGWSDYFLFDDQLAGKVAPEPFVPASAGYELYAFRLLPVLTEVSVVNLALASGLLGRALGLDEWHRPIIPATGQSTFDFRFRPHAAYDVTWAHERGQVEMDAIFVARRDGRELLFVVEAKCSEQAGTLAKHKLAYPVLALRTKVPPTLPVVPVYLRVLKEREALKFLVTECRFSTADNSTPAISTLEPAATRCFVLRGFESEQNG